MSTTPATPLPTHSSPPPTLDFAEVDAWQRLADGLTRASNPFHTLTAATTGMDGRPKCRTVVLRAVDVSTRRLWFHTDVRSPKVAEMRALPWAALLFYDAEGKTQVRADCAVTLHHRDAAAEERWAASKPTSRLCYSAEVGSSVRVPVPPAISPVDAGGFENFVGVECRVERLEWLWLKFTGHTRAEFEYDKSGTRTDAGWLAP